MIHNNYKGYKYMKIKHCFETWRTQISIRLGKLSGLSRSGLDTFLSKRLCPNSELQ